MTCFSWFELCFEIKPRYIFFFFSMQNIWNDWKIYYFPVIFIYKRFNACCSLWTFIVSSRFNATITAYWKHLLSFLLIELVAAFFFFIQTEESLYMIHHDWDLFYDIYNTTNKHYQEKITTFHWFFQLILIMFFQWFKKFFYNFICFIIHDDFDVVTFWMHFMFFIIIIFRKKRS